MQLFLAGYIGRVFSNHSDYFSLSSVAVHCGGVERKESCASPRLGSHSCSPGGWLGVLWQHSTAPAFIAILRIPAIRPASHLLVGRCAVSDFTLVPVGRRFR